MAEQYWLADRQSSDAEFRRLELLGSLYGQAVKDRLRSLGLGPGSRVLEIGPGSGHFVRWLVDEGATVTAFDLSDQYFDTFAHERVTAQVDDARTADLGDGYDFVLAQMVLHHIPERTDVLSRLVAALRPGGWLVAHEPDISFMWTRAGSSAPIEVLRAALAHLVEVGIDYEWGLALHREFTRFGLASVDASLWTPLMVSGSPGLLFWRLTWPVVQGVALANGWISESDGRAVERALDSSELLASSMPAVLCVGQRPMM